MFFIVLLFVGSDPDYVFEKNNPSDSENSNVLSENAGNSQATPENNKNKEILNETVTIEKNLYQKVSTFSYLFLKRVNHQKVHHQKFM